MRIGELLILLAFSVVCFADGTAQTKLRGKLRQEDGKPPAMELSGQKLVTLDGDEPTRGILKDKRLAGADLGATGHFASPDKFIVDPIHTKALPVYHDGKRHTIS